MLTPRANLHHSKLPAPGALGHIVSLSTVESYIQVYRLIPHPTAQSTLWGYPPAVGFCHRTFGC